jgi:hypothetical protein
MGKALARVAVSVKHFARRKQYSFEPDFTLLCRKAAANGCGYEKNFSHPRPVVHACVSGMQQN